MVNLDRQATCPSCGAGVTFKFAGARSVVCDYCRSVVVRTDRGGVEAQGRMADLLQVPSTMPYGAEGHWGGEYFEVTGRVQMDRAGAPGAPWEEMIVWFPREDRTTWVAYAQGRWYATSEDPNPPPLPPAGTLRVGQQVDLGQHGLFVAQEIAQRRVVSGQGSLPSVPKPGVVTQYVDLSGPKGGFATIDYGDGTAAPTLYVGRMFDPKGVELAGGMPLEAEEAKVSSAECPNCGASLPIASGSAQRVVCQYCGTASDITSGTLSALGPAPKPPIEPYLPMGARGDLRGVEYVVTGFVIRSCIVEQVTYSWREYLLFGGPQVGYRWLMEEDGSWQFIEPLEAGNVADSGNAVMFGGNAYQWKQQVMASVDYVIGEFYWKVEIGEMVEATEFTGPGGKVSREKTPTEVNYSFGTPLDPNELAAFGVAPPPRTMVSSDGGSSAKWVLIVIILIVLCIILGLCGGGGSSGGTGVYGGSSRSWGGK
ncbi:MAG: DUF4178 domain-containing protein [Myxococcota bacterium]